MIFIGADVKLDQDGYAERVDVLTNSPSAFTSYSAEMIRELALDALGAAVGHGKCDVEVPSGALAYETGYWAGERVYVVELEPFQK